MNSKIVKALNDQINFELYSAYIYMSMSAYLKTLNLSGFAHWMEIQTKEELSHALKIYNYLIERGGKVSFQPVKEPPEKWESPMAAFKHAHEHEQVVTSRIGKIVDLALKEKDHITNNQMHWFLNEQIEEEANVLAIYQQLKMANNAPQVLLIMDRELAQRVFIDPNAPVGNQIN